MTPTKEQYELAAKFMGLKISNLMLDDNVWVITPSVFHDGFDAVARWEPLTPGDHAYELLIMVLRNRYSMLEHQVTIGPGAEILAAIDAGDIDAVAEKAFLVAVELGRLMP